MATVRAHHACNVPPIVAGAVFVLLMLCQLAGTAYAGSSDSYWYIPTAASLLLEGNADLNEYEQLLNRTERYGIIEANGALYNYFPPGTALFALPFVAVVYGVHAGLLQQDFALLVSSRFLFTLEVFIASSATSMAAVIMLHVARRRLPLWMAVGVALGYVLCTPLFSTASRALWQHGPSLLLLTLALWYLDKAKRTQRDHAIIGLVLAWAFLVRPTNAIAVVVVGLYLLWRDRQRVLWYVGGGLVVAIPFFLISYATFQQWMPPYFGTDRIGIWATFIEALLGNIISPNRGLLWWFPLLLILPISLWLRRKHLTALEGALLLIIVLHWLLISSFGYWWGGHAIGSRFFTDMMPFFVYFIVLFLAEAQTRRLPIGLWAIFVITSLISLMIHAYAATQKAVYSWNATPINVDEYPERIWALDDIQYLRAPTPQRVLKPIVFDNTADVTLVGWHPPETDERGRTYRWMMGTESHIRGQASTSGLYAVSLCIPHMLQADAVNALQLSLNDQVVPLARGIAAGCDAVVLRGLASFTAGAYHLQLTLPAATSPMALGLRQDQRMLGLGVSQIAFEPLTTPEDFWHLNLKAAFTMEFDGNGAAWLGAGWHPAQRTDAGHTIRRVAPGGAHLRLPLDRRQTGILLLCMSHAPPFTLHVDEQKMPLQTHEDNNCTSSMTAYQAQIPAAPAQRHWYTRVSLKLPDHAPGFAVDFIRYQMR